VNVGDGSGWRILIGVDEDSEPEIGSGEGRSVLHDPEGLTGRVEERYRSALYAVVLSGTCRHWQLALQRQAL
jgi:hypothetical protein